MKYRESLDSDVKTELLVKLININVPRFLKHRGVEGTKYQNMNCKAMILVTPSW